jgi:hypothetical protein
MLVYVSIAEYYGTVYVRPPSGGAEDHVLLRGQPLMLRLTIVNEGQDEAREVRPPIAIGPLQGSRGRDRL